MKIIFIILLIALIRLSYAAKGRYAQYCIKNETPYNLNMYTSNIDSYDWEGNERPDNQFHDSTINSGSTICKMLMANKHATVAPFTMSLHSPDSHVKYKYEDWGDYKGTSCGRITTIESVGPQVFTVQNCKYNTYNEMTTVTDAAHNYKKSNKNKIVNEVDSLSSYTQKCAELQTSRIKKIEDDIIQACNEFVEEKELQLSGFRQKLGDYERTMADINKKKEKITQFTTELDRFKEEFLGKVVTECS